MTPKRCESLATDRVFPMICEIVVFVDQQVDRMFRVAILYSMIKFFPPTGSRRLSFRAQRGGDPKSRRSSEAHGFEAFGK